MYRGPQNLKPAGTGIACKENMFSTIDQHPQMGHRTMR